MPNYAVHAMLDQEGNPTIIVAVDDKIVIQVDEDDARCIATNVLAAAETALNHRYLIQTFGAHLAAHGQILPHELGLLFTQAAQLYNKAKTASMNGTGTTRGDAVLSYMIRYSEYVVAQAKQAGVELVEPALWLDSFNDDDMQDIIAAKDDALLRAMSMLRQVPPDPAAMFASSDLDDETAA